jgi:TRAP-type C4-dicarboxylate transport system permease small subunit
MAGKLAQAYDRLLALSGAAAGLTICVLAVMITADVVLRNAGIANMPWLLEVTEYALYITTFLAAPWVLSLGQHVRVDLIFSAVGPAAGRMLEIIADVLGFAVSVVLFWYGARVTLDSFLRGDWVYKELVVPEATLLVFMPIGGALLAVEFIRRAWRATTIPPDEIDLRAPQDGI